MTLRPPEVWRAVGVGKSSPYPGSRMQWVSSAGPVKQLHCTHYSREPVTVLKIKVILVSSVFLFGNHSSERFIKTPLIVATFNISEP